QRRGFGDRPRLGGFHPPPENQGPRLDVRCWLVHRLDDVDRPRPVFPGVRRPGRADRLQARQDLGPAEADRLRGAVRPLRLQGAPSPGGPAPREKGRGPDPHPRGRHGAGRGPARLPFRWPDGRRQPDRRDDGTEDRGALLATHEPGRQAADPARGPHRRGAGLGRSHAVRLRGGDVVMSERIKKWPGVELSAADLNEGKVTQTRFRPNAKYAWSAGEAMSRFLAELQNGRLIARTCHSCKRILFPPRMFCESCFRPTDEMTFLDRTTDARRFRQWEGNMEADYIYTSGVAGERFFVALRDGGKMLASRCVACNLDYLPPRLFCEDCFAELSEFVDVPPEGRVAAVTMAHLDRRGTPVSRPQVWALVTFEGIRGGLVHRLLVP